jgi:hypothetical protein
MSLWQNELCWSARQRWINWQAARCVAILIRRNTAKQNRYRYPSRCNGEGIVCAFGSSLFQKPADDCDTKTTYASITRQPGEEFDADDTHAKLLIQYGNARAAKSDKLETRVMSTQNTEELVPHNPRGKYKRRDMRAED